MITLKFPHKSWNVEQDSIITIFPASEEDYWALSSEDIKVEYSGGCLYIHLPASIKHEKLFSFLQRYINEFLEENDLGEMLGSRVALLLPDGHRPEPDLAYFPPNSYDVERDKIFTGVPPWIIEIFSPSTKEFDLDTKLSWYFSAKVPEIWYIDPDTPKVLRYTLEKDNYQEEKIDNGRISPKAFPRLIFDIDWLSDIPKLTDLRNR